ncbi:MAG: hypothetical protein J7604_11920 [Sporocytophaga sp.]|uniref:Tc toxin subunit A-related protein n=1 Tax=Sporocytophaga sp. TaxID=2231183 RepID=UPI001B2B231A|nr:neuraminidase-like domain-containing protein [Sporocytophaga sp.]MBO9700909.1 hypothetical protein [Sporocytophaga sp.]
MTKQVYTITGSLKDSTQQALANLSIEAWDKDILVDDFLAESTSNKEGKFTLTFSAERYKEFFNDRDPDIYFKIFLKGKLIHDTRNSVLWNVHNEAQPIEIVLPIKSYDIESLEDSSSATFKGTVKHSTGNAVENIKVVLSEKLLRDKKKLSETVTDKQGIYSITIQGLPKNTGFILEVINEEGKLLVTSEVIFNTTGLVSHDFIIREVQYKGAPVFTLRQPELKNYFEQLNAGGNEKPLTVEDVHFVARQTGLEPRDTFHWLRANELEKETTIPAEAFYGLFKQGLPTNPKNLSSKNGDEIGEAIKKAAESNYISDKVAASVQQMVSIWNDYIVDKALDEVPQKMDASLSQLLSIAIKDKPTQKKIFTAYLSHEGSISDFWNDLEKISGDKESAQKIQDVLKLGALTANQTDVMEALVNRSHGSSSVFYDLASLDEEDWTYMLNSLTKQKNKSVVPTFIEAESEDERIKMYAGRMAKIIEQNFPTHSFFGKLSMPKNHDSAFKSTQTDLLHFFGNNPSFDLKKTSTISLTEDNSGFNFNGIKDKTLLVSELQSIQRLSAYTTDFKTMSLLKSDNMDSAHNIVSLPENTFINTYSQSIGSTESARKIYKQAEKSFMESALYWSVTHPNLSFHTTTTPNPVSAPTLRTMFGTLDSCECEHCTSVFSPAAYYTDILNFLYSRTPDVYNELIRRRPDLVHIELTCENTNTPLPYVDLVNELLENFILTHKSVPVTVPDSYQTSWQAKELAANPEHINYEAYAELKSAVYPQALPFNLPVEEARIYLKHLGIEKWQLMNSFFAGSKEAAFDNFEINMERLNLTLQEARILSGETAGDGSANSGLWNFYGFDKSSGYKALTDPADSSKQITGGNWETAVTSRVDVFLQQSDLIYKELLTLLLCDTINPITGTDGSGNPMRAIAIVSINGDNASCELNNLKLTGVTTNHLQKIHRFLRLWRKLGWTMFDLDKACVTFNIDFGGNIAQNKINLSKISQTYFLSKQLKLSIESTLIFWSTIGVTSYTDYFKDNYPPVVSLYKKLFSNKAVLNPVDPAFENPAALTGLLDDHIATIVSALQISDEDYGYLKTELLDNNLILSNLSILYRYTLLSKKLKLSIKDFLSLKKIIGADPFASPVATFSFLLKAETVKTSGFSIDQINYLLNHDYLEETGVAPLDASLSVFLSELRSAVRAIETSSADEQRNTIVQKFSEKLKISATAAGLLIQTYVRGISNPTAMVVEDFRADDFSSSNFLKTYIDSSDPQNPKDYEPIFVRSNPTADVTLAAVPTLFDDCIRLEKIASVINKLKLSDTDLENILKHHASMLCINLAVLPVTATAGNFTLFETLVNLIKGRDTMPVGTPDYFYIVLHSISNPDKTKWLDDLCARTNWDRITLEALVGNGSTTTNAGILRTNFPAGFVNGDLILQIKNCLTTINRIGLNTALIQSAIVADFNNDVSDAIKNAAKAKYDEAQWLKLAKALRDDLREKQRRALVAYVVTHANYNPSTSSFERWKNSDELYEYFLIDVEMKPISMTSRIKQAICSVQLYVDRVLLNLEHANSNLTAPALKLEGGQVEEWKEWRKIYRIWEANRKIFLYPENWLEPELREDKSPFFKDLETQLKQNELNTDNVEDAFHYYLNQLDEVARLEVVGMYHQLETDLEDEDDIDILHVFARTSSNPHRYYHRTLENGEWTAWLKLEIDVDGNHIVPVIFNRKLCLFWLFFVQGSEESADLTDPAPKFWKVQAAWSEYRKNNWTAKRLSKNFITSQHVETIASLESIRSGCQLEASVQDSKLHLLVGGDFSGSESAFVFNNTSEEPFLSNSETFLGGNPLIWVGFEGTDTKNEMEVSLNVDGPLSIKIDHDDIDGGYIVSTEHLKILEKGNGDRFKLIVPSTGPHSIPGAFFFQDKDQTFYAKHSVVNIPMLSTQDFGINNWYSAIQNNWGGYYTYNPIQDPEGPIINPGVSIDEYFREPLQIKNDLPRKVRKAQTIEFKYATVNLHGNETMELENTATTVQPKALRSIKNNSLADSGYRDTIPMYGSNPKIMLLSNANSMRLKYKEEDRFAFSTFYHSHVKTFIKELYKLGVDGLLTRGVQTQPDTISFKTIYDPTKLVSTPYPTSEVDFTYGSAYSQYNWELFFHVPMLIACRLKDDQRFEEAREWFHYIFDPTQSEGGDKKRFWQFKPFYDEAGSEIETLDDLLRNETELSAQVNKWMKNPFMPHVIARMRLSAYMKNVVMKYLDNLIAWADNLFNRDTIEAINEATNLYIMASKILGERPQLIPPRAEHDDTTFDEIKDELDPFSNALVTIETMLAPSAPSASGSGSGSSNALGKMFYFDVPRNEFLMKYWDAVADRLFKIRNSMNIKGVVRTLPLFEPPIDPAMLVRAAAAGMDLSSILSDMNVALPHYRFNFMLQKAMEFSNEVKSLGAALLQALEKRDAEAFALLRSGHELKLLNAVLEMKKKQVDDAKVQLESINLSKEVTQLKYNYYSSREFMNIHESQQLMSIQTGMIFSMIQGGISTIGGVLSAIPNLKIGAPTSMGVTWGGDNLGAMMNAISTYMGIFSAINNAQGSMAGTLGGYSRRMDDWQFQTSTAEKELEQIEKQIISTEIKLAIAEKEVLNQQLQIENSKEADEFMRSKFTNQQLYDWMIGQLSTVYFQSYQLAFDLAKKAEQCYQYELGEFGNTSFVQFGYWDSLKKGLLSAEKLQYDLRRMESSYYHQNDRELEITKHISILMLSPQAILDLRSNGTCTFIVPEALYDLDFPGHFFRRIKSVSISIPCIAGPYTSINATLQLLKHTTRLTASESNYGYEDYSAEDRFRHVTTKIHSIATSTAQNDSGVFDLNFRDERYLPFEGCGAFGEWQLELNTEAELRMFDYNTISDVIVTVRYTAREDGALKGTVNNYLKGLIQSTVAPTVNASGLELNRLFSLRHEFSRDWHKMFYPAGEGAHVMNFEITRNYLPFFVQNRDIEITKISIYGSFNNSTDSYEVELTSNGGATVSFALTPGNSYNMNNLDSLPSGFGLGNFTLTIKKSGVDAPEAEVKDIGFVLNYQCV